MSETGPFAVTTPSRETDPPEMIPLAARVEDIKAHPVLSILADVIERASDIEIQVSRGRYVRLDKAEPKDAARYVRDRLRDVK